MPTVSRVALSSTALLAARPSDRFSAGRPTPLTLGGPGSVSGVGAADRVATPSGALDAGPGASHARTDRGARPPADDATHTASHLLVALALRVLASLAALAPVALLLAVAALSVDVRPAARRWPGPVDLDDTRRCPVDAGCATCGAVDDLAVATADTPVGVLCLTLCDSCAGAGDLPPFLSFTAAASASIAHCEHLGVTLDQAAAARRAECPGCRSRDVLDLGRGDASCRSCGLGFRPSR